MRTNTFSRDIAYSRRPWRREPGLDFIHRVLDPSDFLATTDRYLRDVAPVHVIETMRRREWTL